MKKVFRFIFSLIFLLFLMNAILMIGGYFFLRPYENNVPFLEWAFSENSLRTEGWSKVEYASYQWNIPPFQQIDEGNHYKKIVFGDGRYLKVIDLGEKDTATLDQLKGHFEENYGSYFTMAYQWLLDCRKGENDFDLQKRVYQSSLKNMSFIDLTLKSNLQIIFLSIFKTISVPKFESIESIRSFQLGLFRGFYFRAKEKSLLELYDQKNKKTIRLLFKGFSKEEEEGCLFFLLKHSQFKN